MGVLAGILSIGQMGGFILRHMRFSSRSNGKGGGGLVVAGALALFVVGYIGLFFGRLIKAAISRQREFLADASSVQFTRNPSAIAGALWKIKTAVAGSALDSSHAEDMSHMCIAESLQLSSLMATHPPLDERINAVAPGFIAEKAVEQTAPQAPAAGPAAVPAPAGAMGFAGGETEAVSTTSQQITESVGNPKAEHMDYATALHSALPPVLLEAAHAPGEAQLVVYALILAGTDQGAMEIAWAHIKAHESEEGIHKTRELVEVLVKLGSRARLPILDIVIPELKELPGDSRARFLGTVKALVRVDKRLTLFEFVMVTLLAGQLADDAGKADRD